MYHGEESVNTVYLMSSGNPETVTGKALDDTSSVLAFSDLIPARFFPLPLSIIGGQAFSKYFFSRFNDYFIS